MQKISFIALFALLVTFLPFHKSYALSCIEPPPPEVAIHEYDVVVIATVTNTQTAAFFNNIPKSVKADVSFSFKGYNSNTITFSENVEYGESRAGIEYLLFLNKKGDGYESPLCSPTVKTAGLDMDHLIETLSTESTSVMAFDKTAEISITSTIGAISPTFYILIFVFLIIIALIVRFIYRRGKDKRNDKK